MLDQFKEKIEFWTKDSPRVVGDLCNRPAAIALLGNITGKIVADIGCGTGYVSRTLCSNGAKVFGIDNSTAMLDEAVKFESLNNQGIVYTHANIDSLPLENESIDFALLISVLVYNPPNKVIEGLREISRVLKKNSVLVIGHPHPNIATFVDPNIKWLYYNSEEKIIDGSMIDQYYTDIDGRVFYAKVWHYSTEFYIKELLEVGMNIEYVNDLPITKEIIDMCPYWGDSSGYIGFQNIKAIKI